MEFIQEKEISALKQQELFQLENNNGNDIQISSENNIQEKQIEISRWCLELPDRVESLILSFLIDPDVLGILGQVSKHGFVLNDHNKEDAYKNVAIDIFSNVTLTKFKSFNEVIKNRARVRTNGFYTLQLRYHRRPSNDAFWEDKRYEDIIVNFYRHFRFLKNGRCLYALEVKPPDEIQILLDRGEPINKTIFEGFYLMDRGFVVVVVNLRYTVMRFRLQIMEGENHEQKSSDLNDEHCDYDLSGHYDDQEGISRGGKFTKLKLVEHCSLGKLADQVINELFVYPEKQTMTLTTSNTSTPTPTPTDNNSNSNNNNPLQQDSMIQNRTSHSYELNRHQDKRLSQVLSLSEASAHYFDIPPSADLRYVRQWWWR